MIERFSVKTRSRTEMVDINSQVGAIIRESGIDEGVCTVYVPHTTAGVTINENADPDVPRDIVDELNKIVPFNDNYHHIEGNAAAHIKATLVGSSVTVLVSKAQLVLGTWQSVFFCEFDGPRSRSVIVRVSA